MRRTLTQYRPTILLERFDGFEQVRALLSELAGYRPMRWLRSERRLVPLPPSDSSQNVFFVTSTRPGYGGKDR
jgi:hypothetical protein